MVCSYKSCKAATRTDRLLASMRAARTASSHPSRATAAPLLTRSIPRSAFIVDDQADDVEDDEESDERVGLLSTAHSSGARHKRHTSWRGMWSRWSLVACICGALGALGLLVRNRHGSTQVSDTVALRQQLEQFLKLQSRTASESSTPVCTDLWASQFPSELDKWDGHSCNWKLKWGQCDEFAAQCARTCGKCVSVLGGHPRAPSILDAIAAARTPAVDVASAAVRAVTVNAAADEDETILDTNPADAAVSESTAASRARNDHEAEGGSEAPASERLMPFAGTEHQQLATQRGDRYFIGGARSQQEVLKRVLDYRQQRAGENGQKPTVARNGAESASESRIAKDASGDEGEGPSLSVDDSYEGPSAQREHSNPPVTTRVPESETTALSGADDRARYVSGDTASVISPGSECGVPIMDPSVQSQAFAMGAVRTSSSRAGSHQRTTVTYAPVQHSKLPTAQKKYVPELVPSLWPRAGICQTL